MNRPGAPIRAWISIASLGAVLAGGGCTILGSPVPPGRPVTEVYDGKPPGSPGAALRIERVPPPGQAERTRPVIFPPKIFAVWVPEHLDTERDFKIGSHYVYMKLRDSSWTEHAIDLEPDAPEPVDPSDLTLLKNRVSQDRVGKILVPFGPQAGPEVNARASQPGGRP